MLAEQTTIEDRTVEFSILHLLDHVDKDGCHVLKKDPRHALKIDTDLVLGAKVGHLLVKGMVDVILAQGDEKDHFYRVGIIERNVPGAKQQNHQMINHFPINQRFFITTKEDGGIGKKGKIILLDGHVMTAQYPCHSNRQC